uniref:RNA 3'-terminal-phosphate cyclase (ATP) n=1 Tax=Psilocybe cubensis TaxID=181762 RepID=A0A8H7Y272_PSICU
MSLSAMASTIIDGSVLEGGGQILRNSVSLSSLLSKPVKIEKIRNGRKPPGLRNQHRTGLELAANIASARLSGATNGSTEIEFIPGRINLPNHFTADSVTAGSITLLLQVAFPLLLFSPTKVPESTLTLFGGTNATLAPQVDYTKHVFLPFVQRHFHIEKVSLHIKKRGYFPKGGGEVQFSVTPFWGADQKLRSFSLLERGKVKWIAGVAHYAGLPNAIGQGMVAGATQRLAEAGFGSNTSDSTNTLQIPSSENVDVPVSIQACREPNSLTKGAGSGIVLWAELEGGGIIGGDAVGTKNLPPEQVGRLAAESLIKGLQDGGCVDEWLQDQIIIFMALADGKTAIWLAEQLTNAKFEVEEEESGHVIIRCQGVGYTAPAPPDLTEGM